MFHIYGLSVFLNTKNNFNELIPSIKLYYLYVNSSCHQASCYSHVDSGITVYRFGLLRRAYLSKTTAYQSSDFWVIVSPEYFMFSKQASYPKWGALSKWNLEMSVFIWRGENKLNPHMTPGNRTRATLAGGQCSHHCAIPPPPLPPPT